jgi:abnormal spindle-like microcephaly-associated protein
LPAISVGSDFVKHLGRVGLKVFYRQEPVDELDFTITNLAIDLRDGRLAGKIERF